VMDVDALEAIVRPFIDPEVASVAGNVIIGNRSRTLGLLQQLEYLYGFYFKRADSLCSAVYIVGGAAAAYRRSVLDLVGGLSETIITEDIELSTRLQSIGYKVKYAADAIVYTEGPSTVEGLCKQRLRWKYGRLQTFAKYRSLFFSRKSEHNKYLSWFILPIAFFAEALLFFEVLLLSVFFIYTIHTNDYVPLAIVIAIITAVVSIQILTDMKRVYHSNLLALAPVAWIMFYFIDAVEYQALLRSLSRFAMKQELRWQRWNRVGVFGQ
jgi:poly-beta-1,6-N-acetyl-D-glucosamine synthase